ncbi:hypothetical protein [Gimesia sp.]|uniref:hypothetical protein n=1 Tax=Gimesia sp. TaxID=2024833 RepID=UPI003A9300B1
MNQKNTLKRLKVGDVVEQKMIDQNGDLKTVKMRVVGKKGQPATLKKPESETADAKK